MRLLSFETFSPSWLLKARIAASAGIPTVIAAMGGVIWLLAFPDRWNHAVGGAALFWGMSLYWDALNDLAEFWPWRHERNFVRPAPAIMTGTSMEHRLETKIIPFRKRT